MMELEARHDIMRPQAVRGHRSSPGAGSNAQSCPAVLCVDDDPDLLAILQLFLSAKGFEVLAASNAEEALRLIEDRRPDLIITDFAMPGMSGLELCRSLRTRAETTDIPIILCTGKDLWDVDHGLFDRLVLKPAGLDGLAAMIRGLLRELRATPAG